PILRASARFKTVKVVVALRFFRRAVPGSSDHRDPPWSHGMRRQEGTPGGRRLGLAGISVDPNATALHDRPDDISADPVTQMTIRRAVQAQEVRPLPGVATPGVARA